MNHELGVEKAKIPLQRSLMDNLASYPDDAEVLKKIAQQYTGPVRFSGEHILTIDIERAEKDERDLVDYWAFCEVARGDRLLSDFFRRHGYEEGCYLGIAKGKSVMRFWCVEHQEVLELEHRALVAL